MQLLLDIFSNIDYDTCVIALFPASLIGYLIHICFKYDSNMHKKNDESDCTCVSSYNELLQRQEWKDKRQDILKRDHYRCTKCSSDKNLQVHHKWYEISQNGKKVAPWDYPDYVLQTLCDNCHKRIHSTSYVKTVVRYKHDDISKWMQ